MPRLFVGIELPIVVAEHLALLAGGIPGARWQGPEKLHLTLRFIGEVDGGTAREISTALERVREPRFEMVLTGMGHFPPRGQPRSVWVGVGDPEPVAELHAKVDAALARAGIEPDRRKFAAHVTLARLVRSPSRKVAAFLAQHNLFRSAPFEVQHFSLFSSVLSPGGSKYRVEQRFELE